MTRGSSAKVGSAMLAKRDGEIAGLLVVKARNLVRIIRHCGVCLGELAGVRLGLIERNFSASSGVVPPLDMQLGAVGLARSTRGLTGSDRCYECRCGLVCRALSATCRNRFLSASRSLTR